MENNLTAESKITINSTPGEVWEVLTNPEKIKVYLFGTQTSTDWKEGSSIDFKGEYQGKQYNDKGNVLEVQPYEKLRYNYWSGMSGLEDKAENYSIVTYSIEPLAEGKVMFSWHQQGFSSEQGRSHTVEGLKSMLQQIKELAEV